MIDLDGDVAIVTGAASGNGRAIAKSLAEHGASVVVADVQREPRGDGPPTEQLIDSSTDARAAFVDCDVTDKGDLVDAANVAADFGGLDIMVNNAGIITYEEFTEVTEEQFDRILDVNLKGVFFGSQVAVERMQAGDGGSIVNISSTSGIRGSMTSTTYSASKGGVTLLTYSIAAQHGSEGIRANAIHPGVTETEMIESDLGLDLADEEALRGVTGKIPADKLAVPEDVANAATFLASDYASHVNAESLLVDGGQVNTDTPNV